MEFSGAGAGRPELLAIARFRVSEADGLSFAGRAGTALEALAVRPGYRSGRLARSLDDPELWTLLTTWDGVGAYRRALSAYDVKIAAVPLLSLAIDEPGAYEVLAAPGGAAPRSDRARDADAVAVGDAAAPVVPGGLEFPRSEL